MIRKIADVMVSRLGAHEQKKQFLLKYFMQEVESMKSGAFKKVKKSKKFKMLHANLSLLKEQHIHAVINEYFKMCKMVYRVACALHSAWNIQHNLDNLVDMSQNNDTFRNMIGMVETSIRNLFMGTTDEPVLGDATPFAEEPLGVIEGSPKRKKKVVPKYNLVPRLPQQTDIVEWVLEPLCYDQLLQDKTFVEVDLAKYASGPHGSQASGLQIMEEPAQTHTSNFDSQTSRTPSTVRPKPLDLQAAQKLQQEQLAGQKSGRSLGAGSDSALTSPAKTGRSAGKGEKGNSKSPNKTPKGKSKKKKKKAIEDMEVVDLFPEVEQLEKIARKRLLYSQKYGSPIYPANFKPFFRYVPSRALM